MTFRKAVLSLCFSAVTFATCAAHAASVADVDARFRAWQAAQESSLAARPADLAATYDRMAAALGRVLAANIDIPSAARVALADVRSRVAVRAAELRAQIALAPAGTGTVSVPASSGASSSGSAASVSAVPASSPLWVVLAANPDKELMTGALRFSVAVNENSKNPFTLGAATLAVQLSGYAGSSTVNVYRTRVAAGNLVGTAAVTGAAQRVALASDAAMNRVDPGSVGVFIVTVEGVTFDAAAKTRDWTVRLNDLDLGPLVPSAAAYSNLGAFPLVATR